MVIVIWGNTKFKHLFVFYSVNTLMSYEELFWVLFFKTFENSLIFLNFFY